jgi:segregation and condensation protein A
VETYQIRTEGFEGPFDLLLSLIEKRKLLINDISLSEVADDYLKHLETKDKLPVAETAQFILVGSTLLLIKSKSLLPVLTLTSEEQDSIIDLELRLKLYDRYKTISKTLLDEYGKGELFSRTNTKTQKVEFSPDDSMTISSLTAAILDVVKNLPVFSIPLPKTVVDKVMSLDEMMDRLSQRINSSIKVSFRQFSSDTSGGKMNVIVSFLAMLELVRQGVLRVEQDAEFADIHMHNDSVQLPRYD